MGTEKCPASTEQRAFVSKMGGALDVQGALVLKKGRASTERRALYVTKCVTMSVQRVLMPANMQ